MNTLRLYRGDSSVITEFDVTKTHKTCLFGQGIYLTDSKEVANSYRTKGLPFSRAVVSLVLFNGAAENRLVAYEKGFETFLDNYLSVSRNRSWYESLSPKAQDRIKSEQRKVYQDLIDRRVIVADYDVSSIRTLRERQAGKLPRICVRIRDADYYDVGRLSIFDFPKEEFNERVVHLDGWIRDSLFWEILQAHNLHHLIPMHPFLWGDPAVTAAETLKLAVGRQLVVPKDKSWRQLTDQLRPILQQYGYLGIKHYGGVNVGGLGRHFAYVIWDSEFVNRYRVKNRFITHSHSQLGAFA